MMIGLPEAFFVAVQSLGKEKSSKKTREASKKSPWRAPLRVDEPAECRRSAVPKAT